MKLIRRFEILRFEENMQTAFAWVSGLLFCVWSLDVHGIMVLCSRLEFTKFMISCSEFTCTGSQVHWFTCSQVWYSVFGVYLEGTHLVCTSSQVHKFTGSHVCRFGV
jgi:hypothetical protein